MIDCPTRRALAGLCVCLLIAPRARAQGDGGGAPDGGAPVPETGADAGGGPGEAGPTTTGAPDDTGPGLFEESQSANAPAATGASETAAAPPFNLSGYARGDVFVGKVPGARAGMMKAELRRAVARPAHRQVPLRRRVRRGPRPLRAAGGSATHLPRPARGLRQHLPRADRSAPRAADHRVGAGRRLEPDQQPDAGRLQHPLAARGRHPPRQRRRARVPPALPAAPRGRLDADLPADRAPPRRPAPVRVLRRAGVPLAGAQERPRGRARPSRAARVRDVRLLPHGYAPLPGLTLDEPEIRSGQPLRARFEDGLQPAGRRVRLLDGARRGDDPPRRGGLSPALRLPEPPLRGPPGSAVRPRRGP